MPFSLPPISFFLCFPDLMKAFTFSFRKASFLQKNRKEKNYNLPHLPHFESYQLVKIPDPFIKK